MKKAMALCLALLMALSIAPMAFAEDEVNTTPEVVEEVPESEEVEPVLVSTETEEGAEVEPEAEAEVETETEVEVETEVEAEAETEVEVESETGVDAEAGEATPAEVAAVVNETVVEEAGVTPDSPLWGLERALERISLSLTLGKSAKAKKGLMHAQERLMEVQTMIAEKRLSKAAKAQAEHDEIMTEVEENVAEMGDGDAVSELEDEAEIEQALNEHRALVTKTASLKTKVKGLNAEQSAAISAIAASLGNSTGKVEIEVKAQQSKTKIKLKAKEGLTDEQIAGITAQIKEAVASGKEAKVVLPGKGSSKAKESAESEDEVESEDAEEPVSNETAPANVTTKAKGKK